MTDNNKIPTWFTMVTVLALVWNLLGVLAFFGQMMLTPEMIAQLSQAEQELHANTPTWANIAFGIAVIGGALGSIALLIKKRFAVQLFMLSLAGVLSQMFHAYFISDSFEVYGPGGMTMPIMVVTIASALLWFSKKCQTNKWIS